MMTCRTFKMFSQYIRGQVTLTRVPPMPSVGALVNGKVMFTVVQQLLTGYLGKTYRFAPEPGGGEIR
ncbi:hypothetical protein PoB_006236400 [Plakobranchus ocellatus]|uniref:Uncharacterized protein n=1 Tax=Plakobranchus ocellatus TaxID=259542 RepID=A0AAV4CVE4_9GAST|nr:hypothetical protein PoB_006236400 [Plakobranchus ocellatus]